MTRHIPLLIAALLCGPEFATRAGDALNDTVFKALNDELARSMTLRLEDLDTPYFIQYEVADSASHRVSAAYGGLVQSDENHTRTLVSQLRVGSGTLDNSNFAGGRGGGGRSGLSGSIELPTDDNYAAIRQALWRATDWQYKEAVETITRKRAFLKERNVEDRPPDFSKTPALTNLQELATLSFTPATWEAYVKRISARFRELSSLQSGDVDLAASAENRYLVNSEGLRVRDGHTETLLRITMEAQAEDGQRLSDHLSWYAPTPEQLPPVSDVLAAVDQLANHLAEAIHAPVLDEYTGPVLFDGLAATQLFRQLLGRGFTGQPDPVGAPRRSGQASEDLDNRIGKRILPAPFQIYDDPREAKYENSFLAGHYLVDDEGVTPQRVNLVVDGKLEAMVMSRTPTKQFAQSNGHGRRGGSESPRAAVGCLFVESNKSRSPAELKKDLLDAADAEGLKFGLRIAGLQSRAIGPNDTGGGGRFRRGGGAGRVVGDPIYMYKVFVSDGHEEPVRGCELNGVDVQSLRKILAAGSNRTVQNSVVGATPSSSIIAPPVLLGEIELTRIKLEGEKKPLLDAPEARR